MPGRWRCGGPTLRCSAWRGMADAGRCGRVPGLAAQRGRPAGDHDRAAAREVRRVDDQHPAAGGDLLLPVSRAERRRARRGPGAGGARRAGGLYKPMLEHVARTRGRQRPVLRVRASRQVPPPVLSPAQIEAILRCVRAVRRGERPVDGPGPGPPAVALLAETGLRLGEALALQHRDWHTCRGDTPFIEVVPREHPHRGPGQGRDLAAGVHLRVSWTGFTGSTCGSCARRAPTWRCRTWTPRRSS